MLYYNANVFVDGSFVCGGFSVDNGRFGEVFTGSYQGPGTDLNGACVIPGLVDIRVHGCGGADFSDGNYEGLVTMARCLAKKGITAFAPASMTLPYEQIEQALSTAVLLRRKMPEGCAWLAAANIESPFLSERNDGTYLKKPDFETFRSFFEFMNGIIGVVNVAPELVGAVEFISKAREFCTISLTHTDCDYEAASAAFDAGATHLACPFKAILPIHHEQPAVIHVASRRNNVFAELVCEDPSITQLVFRMFPGRICLISDAAADGVMPDLFSCMKAAVSFGIPAEEAILSATINPARQIGRDYEIGSITKYKRADFIICDEALNRKQVFLGGIPI